MKQTSGMAAMDLPSDAMHANHFAAMQGAGDRADLDSGYDRRRQSDWREIPCDPSKVKFSTGAGKVVNASVPKLGSEMAGDKEIREYAKITESVKVKDSVAMTPSDAETTKKDDCTC